MVVLVNENELDNPLSPRTYAEFYSKGWKLSVSGEFSLKVPGGIAEQRINVRPDPSDDKLLYVRIAEW